MNWVFKDADVHVRPGDHVIWKTEDQKRAAIVQSVNAVDRTAQVYCKDTGTTELASLLELDPHGTGDWSAIAPTDGLGVRRGDFVFIHKENLHIIVIIRELALPDQHRR